MLGAGFRNALIGHANLVLEGGYGLGIRYLGPYRYPALRCAEMPVWQELVPLPLRRDPQNGRQWKYGCNVSAQNFGTLSRGADIEAERQATGAPL